MPKLSKTDLHLVGGEGESMPEDQPFDGLTGADHGQFDQEYRLVDVDEIKPHPRNPNKGDVALIQQSIEANTWYGACTVQKSTGYILAGEHRWRAARQLGVLKIPVIFKDVDDRTAVRIMLVDNESARQGQYDQAVLDELLAELAPIDEAGLRDTGALIGTGFSLDKLAEFERERELDEAQREAEAERDRRINAPRPTGDDGNLLIDPDSIPDDSQAGTQYGLLVVCADEAQQREVFEALKQQLGDSVVIRPVSV